MTAALAAILCAGLAAAAPQSRAWPASDEGAAWLISELPNVEILGRPLEGKEVPPELHAVVEAPAWLELISCTSHYSRPLPAPQVADVTRDGRPYRRYTFAPPAKDTDRWARIFTQWVPHPTAADQAAPGDFVWWFDTPDGPEPPQTAPIRLLPELPAARPPKRLLVHFYNSSNADCVPERLGPVVELLSRVGVNLLGWWEASAENLRKAGCDDKGVHLHVNQGGMCGWPEMGAASPAPRYTNHDKTGRELPDQDLQWVLDEGGKPWATDLAHCRSYAAQVAAMTQDIEWGPVYDNGFSPAGIEAFAKRFQLDPAGLTPQSIWREHRRQWGDFRAEQYLAAAKLYTQAARKANPRCVTLWNPGSPYTTPDPELMSDMIELPAAAGGRKLYLTFPFPTDRIQEGLDVLEPMWYDHGVGQVRSAFEWTRAITARVKCRFAPLFLGQGREFYYTGGDPGEVLRAMNWAALLGGAGGYGYWLTEFSPLQLAWLARTNREAGAVEDILLDGARDPADVTLEPLPQRHVRHRAGDTQWTQAQPDFAADGLWRAFALGNRRLVGLINLDRGLDAYARLRIAGLPTGRYTVVDVSEGRSVAPAAGRAAFTAAELDAGLVIAVPARCGVRLIQVAPEGELTLPPGAPLLAADVAAAYEQYRRPDTEESVLAQRGKLSIAYGLAPGGQPALVIESPAQQVAVRPEAGGAVAQWRAKDPPQAIGDALAPQDGIALDLFWSPPDAHWSGDEKSAYEVVSAKIHGSKAYLTLRQKKQSPSLSGLVLTKTIVVAETGTDVQVLVDIENPGPAPVASFAYWVHHVFRLSGQAPEIVLPTAAGPQVAPLAELVWAKAGEPFIAGNEEWERGQRNGVVAGEWIAQRDPASGNAVLCQNEGPPVAQFYSWRDAQRPENLSVEWMYPLVKLEAGRHWTTRYTLRYLRGTTVAGLPSQLLRAPE